MTCYIAVLNGKYGMINKKDNILIPFEFNEIKRTVSYYPDFEAISKTDYFADYGGFILKKKKLIGFADWSAKLIIAPKYIEIKHYANTNMLFVKTTDNKTGYVNAKDGIEFFEN